MPSPLSGLLARPRQDKAACRLQQAFAAHTCRASPPPPAALQVDRVIGDRPVTVEDMMALRFTTRVLTESMRLYPQPPVLIRWACGAGSSACLHPQPWMLVRPAGLHCTSLLERG